jgi:hypothetical protein
LLLRPPRASLRPRHEVSPRALRALFPLFRYDWRRGAWILRVVGDRYGPVLVEARSLSADSPGPARRGARGTRAFGLRTHTRSAAIALGCILAAVLGFTIARTSGAQTSRPSGGRHASAGLLRVSVPSGWREQATAPNQQLGLTDELVLGPATVPSERLVLGTIAGPETTGVPATLLARFREPPRPQPVMIGGTQFLRYANVSTGSENALYALPTRVGMIVGVCQAPHSTASFVRGCERILASVRLPSRALGPSLDSRYVTSLSATLSTLNAARVSDSLKLRAARDAHQQAADASALAAAHAKAAAALLRLTAGPADPANSAVAAALRATSEAYGSLANAAAHHDAHGYADAQASLTRANAALSSAFAKLQGFGYRIG